VRDEKHGGTSARNASINLEQRSTSALERAAVGSSMNDHPSVERKGLGDLDDLLVGTDRPRARVETSR